VSGRTLQLQHIPSTGDLPIVSEARFLSNTLAFAQRVHARCGPVSRGWWMFKPSVYLMSAEANELVLFDREARFSARLGWERVLGELFPRGLMLRDAEDHRWHRRLMLPAFRKEALARYLERMSPRVESAIADWGQRGDLLFYPAIKRLTLAIAADVFLGAELEDEIDQISSDFTDLVAASVAVIRAPLIGRTYSRGLQARARLAAFIRERIAARRAGDGNDLFTQLCQARDEQDQQYSDEEIVDHLIFIMMAAHDTTTSAITTMVYALAKHPQWQQRLRSEAQLLMSATLQGHDQSLGHDQSRAPVPPQPHSRSRALSLDDLAKMTEIEWVFKEALRLYQPLPTISRRALRDFEIHGFKIPAGTPVAVFPIQVHRSPLWWHEPDQFDPERFAPHRAEHRKHPFQWAPFGGGAHMCLGLHFAEMQVKAILQPLLRQWQWQVAADYEPSYAFAPIAKPRDGLPIRMSRV
jgi:cytochrome P450